MKKTLFFLILPFFAFGQLSKKETVAWEKYNQTKFTTAESFLNDTEKAFKAGLIDISESESECVGRFIGRTEKDGYSLKSKTYGQIWGASERFCQQYEIADTTQKIELSTPDKPQIFTKSVKEDYQYLQTQFTKTKVGFNFKDELSPEIQEQIKIDFAKDGPGNYIAFYDVYSLDDKPTKIKLKARLNR